MASEIETYMFRGFGTHALAAFVIEGSEVRLTLAPWSDITSSITFAFRHAQLAYFEADPDKIGTMPWDIIAVSSEAQKQEKWKFCFACEGAEFGFTSVWPTEIISGASAKVA